MFKRIFRWMKNRNNQRARKISDYRKVSIATKLVCSGALQPPRFSSWWRL